MELERLQAFRLVAQLENISKAAEQLHVSQPSLSQMIHRLEKEWGCPLFRREGRRLRLNRNGEILLETVYRMDTLLEQTRRALEEENGRPPEVSLYVGCASILLPALLQRLKSRTPGVRYRICQWDREEPRGGADLRIAAEPGAPGEITDILLREDIGLALPAGHPLAQKAAVSLGELQGEEFISLQPGWALYRQTLAVLEETGFSPSVAAWVDNPNLLRELLQNGLGLAFVPLLSWQGFADDRVVLRPLTDCSLHRCIYLTSRAEGAVSSAMQTCAREIRGFFGGLPGGKNL